MPNPENSSVKSTERALTQEALLQIQNQLQAQYPLLTKLKVKRFYNQGKIKARAKIGKRNIFVRCSVNHLFTRFSEQYEERYPTAF